PLAELSDVLGPLDGLVRDRDGDLAGVVIEAEAHERIRARVLDRVLEELLADHRQRVAQVAIARQGRDQQDTLRTSNRPSGRTNTRRASKLRRCHWRRGSKMATRRALCLVAYWMSWIKLATVELLK